MRAGTGIADYAGKRSLEIYVDNNSRKPLNHRSEGHLKRVRASSQPLRRRCQARTTPAGDRRHCYIQRSNSIIIICIIPLLAKYKSLFRKCNRPSPNIVSPSESAGVPSGTFTLASAPMGRRSQSNSRSMVLAVLSCATNTRYTASFRTHPALPRFITLVRKIHTI